MSWPASRRIEERSVAAPLRRYVIAGIVAVIGIAVSFLTWIRALEERKLDLANLLGSLADETAGAVEWQLEREMNALHGLAAFWQLHGLLEPGAWRTDTRMLLDHFPGIQWIAWVPRDSVRIRFVARDSTARLDPRVLSRAYLQLRSPAPAVTDRWSDAYQLDVFIPLHPRDRQGLMAAEIRIDSTWMGHETPNPSMSLTTYSDRGDRVVLLRNDASKTAPWMVLRRSLTTPAGSTLRMELTPAAEYARQLATPWPHYFLFTGLVLSLALGGLLFQFLRLRDFSAALEHSNRDLDAQIEELSRRDRELRELNEALEQRVESRTSDLTEALREVETFSHSVSHDLRSPIGAILNFADVLGEDYGSRMDDEGRRLLERIQAAGDRANQLLNALVEFAASGATTHQPRPIDVKDVVQGAFAEALAREGPSDDVRFVVDSEIPGAYADPTQVHRIFVNLIGNALKYSRGQERRELHVGGTPDTSHNTYWVRDNGPGFEPGRAPEIFEPFRKLQGGRTEGTGLGLAIVAKVVRRTGGRTWAESDGKSGATFFFTLPASERNPDESAGRPAGR